jgi:hypothetical protein
MRITHGSEAVRNLPASPSVRRSSQPRLWRETGRWSLSPGTLVTVKSEWMPQYRKPGVTTSGVVKALSPNGKVVRVQMDDLGDSYIAVEHVEPASAEPGMRFRRRHALAVR